MDASAGGTFKGQGGGVGPARKMHSKTFGSLVVHQDCNASARHLMPRLPLGAVPVASRGDFNVQLRRDKRGPVRGAIANCNVPACARQPAAHPHRGRRVGEAANPGPAHDDDDVAQRRRRALGALAQMGLGPHAGPHERPGSPHSSHASGAVSIPDTLSEHTPLATPRAESDGAAPTWMEAMSDPVPVTGPARVRSAAPAASTVPESQSPHAVPGEAAPHAAGDVTPGYSPSLQPACSRGRLEAPEHACSAGAWQQAGAHADAPAAPVAWQHFLPPAKPPGEPYSWLFVPLLHAGAGTLTEAAANAWQQQPQTGPRFAELAGALRRAPGALPSSILRLLTVELACVDRDPALGAAAGDVAFAEALAALPVAPLLLPQAMAQCMNTQGYVPAAAQAALLQAYGGTAVASAAQVLAEDMRAAFGDTACPPARRSRRGR